jgi:hypothetical protein
VSVVGGPPNIEDFALIEILENRIGTNHVEIPYCAPFYPYLTDVGRCKAGGRVGKVGRSTQFSGGTISKTKAWSITRIMGGRLWRDKSRI